VTLVHDVLAAYDIGRITDCRLHMRHISDTYFVRTRASQHDGHATGRAGRYVLRVYRAGWRSDAEIRYELDALTHVAARLPGTGVSVSTPVIPRDGDPLRALHAPEGRRQAALFTFARGDERASETVARARLYGRAAAEIHNATEDFASPHAPARRPIDLDELLERPLRDARPLLREHPAMRRRALRLAERLRAHAAALPLSRLEYGFCYGDFHGGNACVDPRAGNTITFFDFDLCGPGWRAYDLAVFRWGHTGGWLKAAEAERRWDAFREGYAERRTLGDLEWAAIPFFILVRQFWFMGLWGANGRDWGYRWPTGPHFLKMARQVFDEWEPKLPN